MAALDMRWFVGGLAFALNALLALGASTARAPAAVVDVAGDSTLRYVAAAGEHNRLTVAASGDEVTFSDAGAVITIGARANRFCSLQPSQAVACRQTNEADDDWLDDRADVRLGDGDDVATMNSSRAHTAFEVWVDGGAGADRLVGGPGEDHLVGGSGRDRLSGRANRDEVAGGVGDDIVGGDAGDDTVQGDAGDDVVRGNAGHDELEGGSGADDLGGGTGDDFVFYAATRRVRVTLDNRRNDGTRGERDWVRGDVEGAIGSGTLIGNAGPNYLQVLGGEGRGGAGDDTIYAYRGTVYGGSGNDDMEKPQDEPNTKPVRFFGGLGNDKIVAAQEDCTYDWCDEITDADVISCGPGRDTAVLGTHDTAWRDCEKRVREHPPGGLRPRWAGTPDAGGMARRKSLSDRTGS